ASFIDCFFFQAEDGIRDFHVTGVQTCALPISIKLITGIGEPLVGSLMVYDALEMSYRKIRVRKDPNCAVCGENPTVTELIDYDRSEERRVGKECRERWSR